MQKQYSWIPFGVILCLVLSLGCSRTALELTGLPVVTHSAKPVSAQQVENRILQAGIKLGWTMNAMNQREIVGTFKSRRYSVTVFIPFSNTNYSIHYRKSHGLDYDNDALFYGKKIHKKYNELVRDLNTAIKKELRKPYAEVVVEEPQEVPAISPQQPEPPTEPTTMKDLEEWLREKERESYNLPNASSSPSQ